MPVTGWPFGGLCFLLLYLSCGLQASSPHPAAHPSAPSCSPALKFHLSTAKHWMLGGLVYFFPVLFFGIARRRIKQKGQVAQWCSTFMPFCGDFKNAMCRPYRQDSGSVVLIQGWALVHLKHAPDDLMWGQENLGDESLLMFLRVWFLYQQYQHHLGTQ